MIAFLEHVYDLRMTIWSVSIPITVLGFILLAIGLWQKHRG